MLACQLSACLRMLRCAYGQALACSMDDHGEAAATIRTTNQGSAHSVFAGVGASRSQAKLRNAVLRDASSRTISTMRSFVRAGWPNAQCTALVRNPTMSQLWSASFRPPWHARGSGVLTCSKTLWPLRMRERNPRPPRLSTDQIWKSAREHANPDALLCDANTCVWNCGELVLCA